MIAVIDQRSGQVQPATASENLQGVDFWWATSGRDLTRMLQEADYPEDAQRNFLTFYRDVICPRLGGRPLPGSLLSGVGRDGNPFEYSFELKDTDASKAIRFVVDVTTLRPHEDPQGPLSMRSNREVIEAIGKQTPDFDDTWYQFLEQRFCHHDLAASEQRRLVQKAGYQTPLILGFDIHKQVQAHTGLPVLAKCYFPPCFSAVQHGRTRWDVVSSAVRELPNVDENSNIIKSLSLIEDYLSDKPKEWLEQPRYLATDFIDPGKARLKIYMRLAETAFDKIWDYYTLGGRIPGQAEDREMLRDLYALMSGHEINDESREEDAAFEKVHRKATALYFSLSHGSPIPVPKVNFYPPNFAANDEVIGNGLDRWLSKYGWKVGGKPMKDRVQDVL